MEGLNSRPRILIFILRKEGHTIRHVLDKGFVLFSLLKISFRVGVSLSAWSTINVDYNSLAKFLCG